MRSKLKKLKKNIAVLMGGYSDEFEISIKSGNNILKNIDTKLFNPSPVIIEKIIGGLQTKERNMQLMKMILALKLVKNKIHFMVFNIIHGTPVKMV